MSEALPKIGLLGGGQLGLMLLQAAIDLDFEISSIIDEFSVFNPTRITA